VPLQTLIDWQSRRSSAMASGVSFPAMRPQFCLRDGFGQFETPQFLLVGVLSLPCVIVANPSIMFSILLHVGEQCVLPFPQDHG
jgi:hypothetical protein